MKKLSFIIVTVVIGLLTSCNTGEKTKKEAANTEEKTATVVKEETPNSGTFFVGKWKIIPSGLPGGDKPMIVSLERKDGKLTGTLTGEGSTEVTTFYSVTEKPEEVILNFKSDQYDVNMTLHKKDENNVTGSIMGMFNVVGSRITK
ncbi:MAG: hypothetical protein PHO94_09575 [Petrimonas sp.]|nr:hypothetical protein [Petrimonas sp.]